MLCDKKIKYTKKDANAKRNYIFRERHIELRIYECYCCGYWHLTKQAPYREGYKKITHFRRINPKR